MKGAIKLDGGIPTWPIRLDRMLQFPGVPMLMHHEPKSARDWIRVTDADPRKEQAFCFKGFQQSCAHGRAAKSAKGIELASKLVGAHIAVKLHDLR
jgi:hypothetical protein